MKIAIVSYKKGLILPSLKNAGFKIVNKNPDVVIAFGGDGTFLLAEEKYPNKPKVFVYHSNTCIKCSINNYTPVIDAIKQWKNSKKISKIEAQIGKEKITALNDINIHYNPPRALRFNVKLNNKLIAKEIIGDGVLISTPFGSNAYFKSITGKNFKTGIGIAFNNSVQKIKPMLVSEDSKIEIEILRENGIVAHDTSKKLIKIKKGSKIKIQQCKKSTDVIMFKKRG